MIEAPRGSRSREFLRTVVEAAAQTNPVSGALFLLFDFASPSAMERSLAQWRNDITASANTSEQRLDRLEELLLPRLRLSATALSLAIWISRFSEDGLSSPIEFEEALVPAFPDESPEALKEACFELQTLAFVSVSRALGHPVRRIRAEYRLFWTFDPLAISSNPTEDAVIVATRMLEDEGLAGLLSQLHAQLGWPRRRFNPAVARLMPLIPPGRTRQTIQNEYPTLGFVLAPEDRVRLRRFVEDPESRI